MHRFFLPQNCITQSSVVVAGTLVHRLRNVLRLGTGERSIILEAAQQSRRGKLPVLHNVVQFREACESATGVSLLPWEEEKVRGIGAVLAGLPKTENTPEVSIFVGPEGGFSPHEVNFARSCGIEPVSLGSRILRAETAGLVAAAVTLYEFGEMGGSL
ncbi:MAG: RsmE family RNA methyltransferase [Dehalococcoidia bacterium]